MPGGPAKGNGGWHAGIDVPPNVARSRLARFKTEWALVRAEIRDFRGGNRLSRDELHDRAVR
jgi:hypothetical protein